MARITIKERMLKAREAAKKSAMRVTPEVDEFGTYLSLKYDHVNNMLFGSRRERFEELHKKYGTKN